MSVAVSCIFVIRRLLICGSLQRSELDTFFHVPGIHNYVEPTRNQGLCQEIVLSCWFIFLSSWPRNRILRRSISRHRFRSLERSLRPLASRLTSPERALASSATSVELAIAYSGDISSRGRNHGCTWEDCDVHRVFFCFFVIRARIPVSAVHAFFFFPFCCCCG